MAENKYYKRMTDCVTAMTGGKVAQSFPPGRGSVWTDGKAGEGVAHWHLYIPRNFVNGGPVAIRNISGKAGVFANLNQERWLIIEDGRTFRVSVNDNGSYHASGWCEVVDEQEIIEFVKGFEDHAARYISERFHDDDIKGTVSRFLAKRASFADLRRAIS